MDGLFPGLGKLDTVRSAPQTLPRALPGATPPLWEIVSMHDSARAPATIYHYDRDEFFFIGEGPADLDPIGAQLLLPAFATFTEPPLKITDGPEIAVFDPVTEAWALRPRTYWVPQVRRRAVRLGHVLTGDLTIVPLPHHAVRYRGIPRIMSPLSIAMALSSRLSYLNERVAEIQITQSLQAHGCSLEALGRSKLAAEDFILHMKRFLDDVFVMEWIELERDPDRFGAFKKIAFQGYHEINKAPPSRAKDHLIAMRECDPEFLQTVQDLRNSFVHHQAIAESYRLVGVDYPTINTIFTKDGDFDRPELIEVYLEDLVRSLNGFVQRTFHL